MAPKPPVSKPGKPAPGDGKKVLGMPRKTAAIAGIALLAGVAFILWRSRQDSSAATPDTGAQGTTAVPDSQGVQGGGMQGATGTETLVIKIRQLQGHKRKPPVPAPKPKPKGRGSGGPPRRKTGGPPTVGRGRGGRTGAA